MVIYDCHNVFCEKCPYKLFNGEYNKPVQMQTGNDAKILIVAQAPGVNEWLSKIPLISDDLHSGGDRLNKSLLRTCNTREIFDVVNVVQCIPGKHKNGRDKKP